MFTFITEVIYKRVIFLGYNVSFLADYHKRNSSSVEQYSPLPVIFSLNLFFPDVFLFSLISNSLVKGILIKHALIADSDP